MAVLAFQKGRLKIAAHVREELELAGISFDAIQCKSGGTETPPDTARLIVTVRGVARSADFKISEVEECEDIVAGDPWRKIAALIEHCRN